MSDSRQKMFFGRGTPGEISIDAKKLVEKMATISVNGVITWADISAIIGRDIRKHGSPLNRARRILERDHRIQFEAVKGVGLRRLDDAGCVAKAHGYTARQAKSAKRIARILACANYDSLNEDAKRQHDAIMSLAAVTAHINSAPQLRRISAAVSSGPLALGHTLKALM